MLEGLRMHGGERVGAEVEAREESARTQPQRHHGDAVTRHGPAHRSNRVYQSGGQEHD